MNRHDAVYAPVLTAVADLLEHGYITDETMKHITPEQARTAHTHLERMRIE